MPRPRSAVVYGRTAKLMGTAFRSGTALTTAPEWWGRARRPNVRAARPRRRRGSAPARLKASRMAAGSSNCAGVCLVAHESPAGQAWQAGRYP